MNAQSREFQRSSGHARFGLVRRSASTYQFRVRSSIWSERTRVFGGMFTAARSLEALGVSDGLSIAQADLFRRYVWDNDRSCAEAW